MIYNVPIFFKSALLISAVHCCTCSRYVGRGKVVTSLSVPTKPKRERNLPCVRSRAAKLATDCICRSIFNLCFVL